MAFELSTTWATTKKDFNGGDGGLAGDIALTFPIAATTSIKKGMFVMLSAGYITPCTATTDAPIGVAVKDADNSSGSAGDLSTTVVCRGIVQVNAFIEGTGLGSYDDALVPFAKCGLSGDGGTTVDDGQSISCGANPTVFVGTMLSTNAVAAGPVSVKALVYIDLIGVPDQA